MSSKSEWKSTQAHQRPRFKFFLKFQVAMIVRLQFVHWRETSMSMTWVSDPYLPYPPFHHPSPDQVLVAYLPCHPFPYHRPSPCHLCHLSIRCMGQRLLVAGVIRFKVLNGKEVESFVSFDIETHLHPCHLCHRVHQLVACHPLVFTVAGHGCNLL